MLLSHRWCVTAGSPLTYVNKGFPYVLGGRLREDTGWVDAVKRMLQSSWGVTDTDSLRKTIAWLDAGHSAEYENMMAQLAQGGNWPNPQQNGFAMLHHHEIGQRSLLAWDGGRMVALAGWGYMAGFIEEEEAYSILLGASLVLQRAYSSWEEFGYHYGLGYQFWSGGMTEEFAQVLEDLRTKEESPWKALPWLTPLVLPGIQPRGGQRWGQLFSRLAAPAIPVPTAPRVKPPQYGGTQRLVRDADGAHLVDNQGRCEWLDAHITTIPRAEWRDEWGPIGREHWDRTTEHDVLAQFFEHLSTFNSLTNTDPLAAEKYLLERGYQSMGQYYRVFLTVAKQFATPTGPWLAQAALDGDLDASRAMAKGGQAAIRWTEEQSLTGAAHLLAPIDGLSLDMLATVSAHQTAGMQGDEYNALLARYGFDQATYIVTSQKWTARMQQGDPTGALGQKFSRVYAEQLAILQAQRPPEQQVALTFELYCEINGAMAAWGQQGIDLNAELPRVFGMSMTDYCMASMKWGTLLSTEPQLTMRYFDLLEKATKKYSGNVGNAESKADGDLDF